ncbi:MAG: hypothetical protein C9356_15820 [Oleiphilus sp.]|nr:MAG: hypothetical protein C9356_15820 [Oleiphilus sp.]
MPDIKLLYVDDEEKIREDFEELFSDFVNVDTAGSVKEAVQLIQSGVTYQIVITDLKMPHQDGEELLGYLKSQNHPALRCLCSAFPPSIDTSLYDHFIPKPWDYRKIHSIFKDNYVDRDEL